MSTVIVNQLFAKKMGSSFVERKLHKISKMVKPFFKFIAKKPRTNVITPSTCNYYVTESAQNAVNEASPFELHFKFCEETIDNMANEETESYDNSLNEELEARLHEHVKDLAGDHIGIEVVVDGEIVIVPVPTNTYFATPVHFIESTPGHFSWVPLPDSDVCSIGDLYPLTECQLPEQQVPA